MGPISNDQYLARIQQLERSVMQLQLVVSKGVDKHTMGWDGEVLICSLLHAKQVGIKFPDNTLQITAATGGGGSTDWSDITNIPSNVTNAVPNTTQVIAGTGLTGGGALTGNVTLALGQVPMANLPTGDYSSKITSGTYAINITGQAQQAVNALNLLGHIADQNWNVEFNNTQAHARRWAESNGTSNNLNRPGPGYWFVEDMRDSGSPSTWGRQLAWGYNDNPHKIMTRDVTNGVFSAWLAVVVADGSTYNMNITGSAGSVVGGVPWAGVTGKPMGEANYALNPPDAHYMVGAWYLPWRKYKTSSPTRLIFDASDGKAPNGTNVPNGNAQNNWQVGMPMLVGWDGSQTYGMKVDTALWAENADYTTLVNKPSTFPPDPHTHDWATGITGKPATFPPSAHVHAAADTTSGVFAVARLGTGTPGTGNYLRGDGTWTAVPPDDWSTIIGKPSTFPPSAHTHPWGEVTGKPYWLASGVLTADTVGAGFNFNTIPASGFWDGNNVTGAPGGATSTWAGVIHFSHYGGAGWGWQIGVDNWQAGASAKFYCRSKDGGNAWAAWEQIVLADQGTYLINIQGNAASATDAYNASFLQSMQPAGNTAVPGVNEIVRSSSNGYTYLGHINHNVPEENPVIGWVCAYNNADDKFQRRMALVNFIQGLNSVASRAPTTPDNGQPNYAINRSWCLNWKHYGAGHVIFDASNATAPNGAGVNNSNAATAWAATYPTLMGWNGSSTYGVRVDTCRYAELAYTSDRLQQLVPAADNTTPAANQIIRASSGGTVLLPTTVLRGGASEGGELQWADTSGAVAMVADQVGTEFRFWRGAAIIYLRWDYANNVTQLRIAGVTRTLTVDGSGFVKAA